MSWDEIKQWLRDHVPWFLLWALNGLLALVDAVRDAWNFMRDTISNAWGWFLYFRTTDWNRWLVTLLNAWGNWLVERLNSFSAWLAARLNSWSIWLVERLTQWNVWLVSLLNSWGNWIFARVTEWYVWLVYLTNEWRSWLSARLSAFNTWLIDRLNSWGNWLVDKLNRFNAWLIDRLNSWGNWLVDRLNGFSAWLLDRLNDWGAWLEDRHRELLAFLYGEAGVVTGAINELKEWVKGLFTIFANEIILHLLDWMSYVAPPIEAIDEMGPHFSSFTDTLVEWARAWKELKEDWVKEAVAMMEAFAAELRGEEEMDLLTPSETILQYWQMLTPEQIKLIVEPPIKG